MLLTLSQQKSVVACLVQNTAFSYNWSDQAATLLDSYESGRKLVKVVEEFRTEKHRLPSTLIELESYIEGTITDAAAASSLLAVAQRAYTEKVDDNTATTVAQYTRQALGQHLAMQTMAQQMAAGADEGKVDLEALSRLFSETIPSATTLTEDTATSFTSFPQELIAQREDRAARGVKTTFYALDKQLRDGQGLGPGEYAIVVGPTNSGKTSVLINLGRGMYMDGKKVLHISLEMTKEQMMTKYLASMADVPIYELDNMGPSKMTRLVTDVSSMTEGDLRLEYVEAMSMTVAQLEGKIRNIIGSQKWTPDVVVLDYADLLKATKSREAGWAEQEETHIRLRSMASSLNLPVFTAAQTNRAGLAVNFNESGRRVAKVTPGGNHQVAGSLGKIMTADYVFTLGQQFTIDLDDWKTQERAIVMRTTKSRSGAVNIDMIWKADLTRCRMHDAVSDTELLTSIKEYGSKGEAEAEGELNVQ